MRDQHLHRNKLLSILRAISLSSLRHQLGFKGGTLAYFLHQLPRFSTDLDFDRLSGSIQHPMDMMRELLKPFGTIKDEYDKQHTYFFLLDYGMGTTKIKIEISKKTSQYDHYETQSVFGVPLLVMQKDCILANKLLALRSRWKNRDLFDVNFFLSQGFVIDEQIIKHKAGLDLHDFLRDIIAQIPDHFSPKTILAEIGDLITDKQKHRLKTTMIDETMGLIQLAMMR